jgi:hypothetical protein
MRFAGVLRSVAADWRTLLLVYLAGWPGLVLVLALTWVDMSPDLDPGSPLRDQRLAKLLSPLYVAQIPLTVWTAGFMYGRNSRQRLTDTLPLSVRELNLSRILAGGILLVAGGISWFITFAVYRIRGETFPPWLMLFALLFFVCYLFLSMRHVLVRAAPHVLIVVMWLAEILLDLSPRLTAIVWTCGLLVPLGLLYGWRSLTQPPPRWAR